MRLKITDGDLMIVTLPAGVQKGSEAYKVLSESVTTWLKNRGINNVSITTLSGIGDSVEFKVLSVNDVFEQEVLKNE